MVNPQTILSTIYFLAAFVMLVIFIINLKGNYSSTNLSSVACWVCCMFFTVLLLYNVNVEMGPEVGGGISLFSSSTLIISICLLSMN